ncbi:MAG: hypothetical protein KJ607_13375, partial [Bacteroidetes bacterium]|nr:hypothetical protein [Bacteroidota bacterium]
MRHIITALLLFQGFHFSSFCQSGSDSVSVEYLNYGLCFGDSSYFLISDTTGIDSVFWHFNDHPSGPFNTSTEFNPVHLFSHTGSFDVELIVYIDGDYLVVIQTVTIYEYPSDLFLTDSMLCFGEPVAVVYSQPDLPGAVFSWDFAGGTTAGGTGPGPYLVSYDQPGEYIISMEVTRYGCTSESQNSIIIPGPIAIDIASQDVLCYGESEGFIDLSVSGGTGPYAFLWSYCGKETEDIMNITAGTYFVTVTDANYCQEVRTVVIEQPSDPLAVGYVIAGACTGGEPGNIYLDASGGTPDYTYIWQDTAADDSFMTGAEPGSYMVTVTDINACTVVLTTELTTQEFPLSAGIQVQHVSCFGLSDGSAAVDIDGGDAPYAFIWNYNAETSESLTGIPAGEYAVTTTDARLCTAAAETIVTQPEQQDIQLTGNTDICFGQQTVLSASVTGMEQDECQFMWSDASTGHSITVAPEINTTYTVTVTDTAGCTGLPVTITVEVGAPIHTEWSPAQDIICPGAVNVITFSASGGDGGPYLTVLQNGSLFTSPYIIIPQEPAVLVVITLDGCGTTPVTDTIAIPVYEPYKFDVKTDRIAGCEPLEVHFSETGEGNATAVFWDFDNDSVIDAENTICPAFIYGSEGVYDVSITVED